MTKRQAGLFFVGATGIFLIVFLGLTVHSHTRFPALTNADRIDEAVLEGQDVWHRKNCINCHTLLGEGAYFAPDLTRITAHRGRAYLTAFMQDPALFYSEEQHRRLMNNPELTETEIANLLSFLEWIDGIDNFDWPPRPILVSGNLPGTAGGTEAPAAASSDPVAQGEALFRGTPGACFTCHSTAPDVHMAGPSLAGLAARATQLVASPEYTGAATEAESYIRESILDPSAHLVPGTLYSAGGRSFMPDNYEQLLTPEQISQLVAYLMTLR
ncbi:MAG TPA: c-type cytochrome [Longimicrobiales bacterium]|nr:c-type cytochrome [Longimicrobiales bacterium]